MKRAVVRLSLVAAFLLVVAVALYAVRGHERTLADGQVVLAELAPVDPRSLMQGDYMALVFAIDRELAEALSAAGDPPAVPPQYAYLSLDAAGRASLSGVGADLLPGEAGLVVMRIRRRGGRPSIGPNAYFFQEGAAERFEAARWGEFRVAPNGVALLANLRNEELERLE